MNSFRAWITGLMLILFFVFISELTVIFNNYVYHRLGVSRNLVLTMFWLLPAIAGFLATKFSSNASVLAGFSYIPILTAVGPITHFLLGEVGFTLDFTGPAGFWIVVQIYFVLSLITIGIGSALGKLCHRKPSRI